LVKERGKFFQDGINPAFDGSQGMIHRHGRVQVDGGDKVGLFLRFASHNGEKHEEVPLYSQVDNKIFPVFQQPAKSLWSSWKLYS